MSDRDDHWRPYNSINKYIEQFNENQNNSRDVNNSMLSDLKRDIGFWNELLPKLATMLSQTNTIPQEYQISPGMFIIFL